MGGRMAIVLVWLGASSAPAAIVEGLHRFSSEEELRAMQERGELSVDAMEGLLQLLEEGVDLERASQARLMELPGLTDADVDAIIAVRKGPRPMTLAELTDRGALTQTQVELIRPFIRVPRGGSPVSGTARWLGRVSTSDDLVPPQLLLGRARGPWDVSAGVMVNLTRRSVGDVRASPERGALVTRGPGLEVTVPRFFAEWKGGSTRLVAGTFALGYGERLTLDNTRSFAPHGLELPQDFRRPTLLARACQVSAPSESAGGCSEATRDLHVTPDFDVREVFRGVAASVEDLHLTDRLSVGGAAFASYQTKSLYQYEVLDRRECVDSAERCTAPSLLLQGTESARVDFSTLSSLYDELAFGGHVELSSSERWRMGVTGYLARPTFHDATAPLQLDFQPWSRTPAGGPYGAVGVHAQTVVGRLTLAAEAARSIDQAPGGRGGGFAFVQRSTVSLPGRELELSLRAFDDGFSNPLARPVSAPDEYDGQRARNEVGARARYVGPIGAGVTLITRLDVWFAPTKSPDSVPTWPVNVAALLRADFPQAGGLRPGVWVDLRHRTVSALEARCATEPSALTQAVADHCDGALLRIGGRLEARPSTWLQLGGHGTFTLADDARYSDHFRQDVMAWLEARAEPSQWLALRLGSRYLYRGLADATPLEHSLWSFLEVAWTPRPALRLALRGEQYAWLDRRAATRTPGVEHRFLLDVQTTF